MSGYDLEDVYTDACKQLKNLLSPADFKILTTKTRTQPDDLKTLLNGVIKRGSGPHSKTMGRAHDVVQGLVVRLKRFEGAIDMIIQSSPQIMGLNLAGLIWGGLKFVLVIVGDALDTLNTLVDLLDEVLKGLPVLEVYVEIFGASTNQLLRAPLTNLYAELITFVIMAVRRFDSSKRPRLFALLGGSKQDDFKALFVRIEKAGREVDRVANAEHMRQTHEAQQGDKAFQQEMRFRLASTNSQDVSVLRSTPFIEVPLDYLSVHFTGRENELAKVEEFLSSSFGHSPTRCVIHGMPGLGKTQLALQFAKRTYERKLYTHVMWISATSVEMLNQGYCKVLDLFGHQDRLHPDQSVRLSAAQRWLEGCDEENTIRWLLIFDNVDGTTLNFLRRYLPRQNSRGKMLFTTRTEDIAEAVAETAGQQHHILELQPLELRDATNLLLMEARPANNVARDAAQAEELVKRMGCLPLMVSQAASLVKAQKTFNILLEKDPREQNLEIIGWDNKLTKYEATSVKTVFLRQFEELEHQSLTASHLMRLLSFLNPESIPLKLLKTGAAKLLDDVPPPPTAVTSQPKSIRQGLRQRWDDFQHRSQPSSKTQANESFPLSSNVKSLLMLVCTPGQLQIAVQQLRNFSLVGYQSGHDTATLRIHDVIQAAVQDLGSKADDQDDWFQAAARLVCSAFSLIKDPKSVACWGECEQLVLHVQSLSRWNDVHSVDLSILLTANCHVASFFQSKGRYHEAEKLRERVLESCEKQLGVEHLETLKAVNDLATVYSSQGRYKEAETAHIRALDGREKQLGIEHRATLGVANNLGLVYTSQGRYKEAETLFIRALEGREKQGPEHPNTLAATNNIGLVYKSQGRYKEAETAYIRALEGLEKQLGAEHQDTLTIVNNLANVYKSQHRYKEAEMLFIRALEGREKHLGPEHPDTLGAVNNLGNVYWSQGRYKEAETLHIRVLEGWEKQLGAEHPDTLTTVNNLANVYKSQRRYKEAETLFIRALEGREKQLGVDHPATLGAVNNLGAVYKSQGRYKEAETAYIRALEGRKKQLGLEHPDTLSTANRLAKCQSHRSQQGLHTVAGG